MRFFQFFSNRRPSAAAVLGLVFGPAIVMAYLGRGRLAMAYLLIANLAVFSLNILFPHLTPTQTVAIAFVSINLIGCFHGYVSARAHVRGGRYPWFARWYNVALLFWFTPLCFAFAIRTFVVQPFSIPAGSMMPTLIPGDYALVSKFNYGYGRYSFPYRPGWIPLKLFGAKPKRGDVVVLALPPQPEIDFAERVMGLPGDHIQMKAGIVFINGQAIPRDAEGTFVSNYAMQPGELPIFGEVLDGGVRYQTVDISTGSRGDNTREYIVPEGHYFVMGDNRDNSNDSRFEVGFVPEANIYGKVWLLFRRNGLNTGWFLVR